MDLEDLNLLILEKAKTNLKSISYEQYRDQVEEYLSLELKPNFSGPAKWGNITAAILEKLHK